jgi:ribonuclease HI
MREENRMPKPHVRIYTDGSCVPNPGPGGWAAVLIAGDGRIKELSGNASDTTNNRMELTAALRGLQALTTSCRVELYTDSEYVASGITTWLPGWLKRGWRTRDRQPVKNQDLWQDLQAEIQRHEIVWKTIPGHAGNPYNERADRLAALARDALPLR